MTVSAACVLEPPCCVDLSQWARLVPHEKVHVHPTALSQWDDLHQCSHIARQMFSSWRPHEMTLEAKCCLLSDEHFHIREVVLLLAVSLSLGRRLRRECVRSQVPAEVLSPWSFGIFPHCRHERTGATTAPRRALGFLLLQHLSLNFKKKLAPSVTVRACLQCSASRIYVNVLDPSWGRGETAMGCLARIPPVGSTWSDVPYSSFGCRVSFLKGSNQGLECPVSPRPDEVLSSAEPAPSQSSNPRAGSSTDQVACRRSKLCS